MRAAADAGMAPLEAQTVRFPDVGMVVWVVFFTERADAAGFAVWCSGRGVQALECGDAVTWAGDDAYATLVHGL